MRAAAFLGRPNSGKSSLFNALTGADAHIGNFPGITVDVLEAKATLPSSGEAIVLYDLPGLYSLDPRLEVGSDERVARDFLDERARAGDSLVLVQVIDANQLALGLRLTRDLQRNEAELPVLVVITQTDVLAKDGKEVDTAALTAALGCPFVATHARAADCREVVLGAIARAHTMTGPSSGSSTTEDEAWEPDALAASALRVRAPAPGETPHRTSRERTERVDRVLLHPIFGLPIFVLIMAGLFATVFLIADPATDLADAAMRALGQLLRRLLGEGLFASLVVDGVLGGVGTVLAFLPQILLLIALMDVLEATGYLARAAFLVDRLFRAFGLGGKSFVPLLTGHACAVPAISATRIIRDPRERLTTILVIPLMTCSARLPVYTLVVATFFGGSALTRAAVTTGLYFGGIASGLVAALVIRRTVVRGKGLPLLLEMPAYRAPVLRSLLRRCWLEATDFLRRAGTIILASAVALWILLNIPVRGASAPDEPLIERSAAAAMGRALEPVTRPLGFDWRINVGLIGSFGARELMVGTMGVIFGVEGADKEPAPLVEKIRAARRPDGSPSYDRPAAVALLVFFVIACQCMSTLAAIRRETRGWKMPAFVLAYSYVVAWVLAAGAHRIAAIWW